MRKNIIVLVTLLIFLIANPAGAESNIPEGAKDFADKNFLEIVKGELDSQSAGNFNLNQNSTNITFGPLFEVYTMSKSFVTEQNSDHEKGIHQTGEYIAVVYQDDKPINVIGTYKNEAGVYEMSTFGYGFDLAKKLDKLKEGEKILYEAPFDAWYVYTGKKVKPLTETAKQLMKEEKSTKDFQNDIHERYKNLENNSEMGGGIETSENSEKEPILYSVIGVLGIFSIFLFFKNRKLKKN